MTLKELRALKKHTLCKIQWYDVQEDSVGDPNNAHLVSRTTFSLFWGTKMQPGTKIRNVIFSATVDPDGDSQSGWLCIPLSLINKLEVIVPAQAMEEKDAS